MVTSSFPPDVSNQIYVTIQALVAGHVWLRESLVFLDSKEKPADVGSWVPAFSFLITHPIKGKALFDLGVRKVSALANNNCSSVHIDVRY